jgi:hypothetical protein
MSAACFLGNVDDAAACPGKAFSAPRLPSAAHGVGGHGPLAVAAP